MVRFYQPGDLGQCASVYAFTMNSEPWCAQWTEELAYKYISELAGAPRAVCVVVDWDGELVGAAFCRARTWYDGEELYVEEIFVQPEYQARGLGGQMLRFLEEYIMENGMNGFVLNTNRRVPAVGFYEHNGFEVNPEVILMYKVVEHRLFCVENDG